MKKTFYIFLFLNFIFSNFSYSQKYNSVDSIVDTYPKNIITAERLIELINKDFSKQDEKARAAFRWVATNISYDVDLAKSMVIKPLKAFSYKTEKEREINEKLFKIDLVKKTLMSRKAVCQGYAILYEDLCEKLGIESKTITGYLKTVSSQIGELPNITNHAWNVIKIDNEWKFIDTTLGAGYISSKNNLFKFYFNDGYFFMENEKFFLNHYPLDEKWILLSKNKNDFAQLPLFFGDYFKYNYKITKPKIGIINSADNKNLIFEILGLNDYDYLQYSDSISRNIIHLENNNSKEFSIPIENKRNSYISIYVGSHVIAMFKII
jgi:transglutaminase/protease-like cytokinesis protein 3